MAPVTAEPRGIRAYRRDVNLLRCLLVLGLVLALGVGIARLVDQVRSCAGGDHARQRARVGMMQLLVAIEQYRAEGDGLLGSPGSDTRLGPETPGAYDRLIEALSAGVAGGDGKRPGNTQPRRFLLVPVGSAYVDPWGSRYVVCFDLDGDGKVAVGGRPVQERLAVYSVGQNRRDEHGEGDDVSSWAR